jgi:hypothetical protein
MRSRAHPGAPSAAGATLPAAMLTIRARRPITLFLAALITVLATVGAGVTLAPAAHAASVQNRARAFIPAAQPPVRSTTSGSPCSHPDSIVPAARIMVGFCVATEDGAGAGASRGLSDLGGIFSSESNEAGGSVVTSVGDVAQKDFAPLVNGAMYRGDVNIISGVHGLADGTTVVDASLYRDDVKAFGDLAGVFVHNFPDLTPAQITGLLNGEGTTIGGFCNKRRMPGAVQVIR